MKNPYCSVVLALTGALALCADDVTSAKYPDADSVTVNDIEKVAYNPDGTSETLDECWTKILTEKGRRDESSVTLRYSKRYGAAEILYVGVIGADGKEREVDVSKTTKESTDNSSMSANIYDPLDLKIVCTIPGLKVGDTVHVKTVRKTLKPRCVGKWSDISVMEWSHPIVRATFEVKAPKERPLRNIEIFHPLGNIATNLTVAADGSTVHTFTVTNSAQVFPDPSMPPLYTQVQNVRVSTAADWPEISKWYWELCAPHLAKTNAAMLAKVKELRAGAKGSGPEREDAVIRAIYKFVSQEVRYMGLTMEDTSPGYAPHDVDVTFDNRYGVCRDKAGLLVAMLRAAGFRAFPVLIHAGAKLEPSMPQPFFNHAIAAVDRGNFDYVLMDPTNENTKDIFPAYLNDKSYIVARPEGDQLRTSPTPSPDHNTLSAVTRGRLKKDGSMFVESKLRFLGINDTAYRGAFARWKPEDRVKFFDRALKRLVPGAEIVRVEVGPKDMRDTEQPLTAEVAANLPEMLLRGRTQVELNLPTLTKVLGIVNFVLGDTSLEKRKYPLVLDVAPQTDETLVIDLGDALGAAANLPRTTVITNGCGYWREFKVADGKLTMRRRLNVSKVEFSPAEYVRLRESLKEVEKTERERPVFRVNRLAEANVRYLLDRSETDIVSDREWKREETVVKQVLTYEGKKRSAELKFSYNPAVQSLELAYATVSNRNGRVYSVSAKEQNVMDCGWAASAPRYPASRMLIVNLPSVEIGSVISYKVVHSVTNAAAPFYAAYSFDFHEPVDRRFVRVDDWTRDVRNPRRLIDEPNQPAACFWRDQVIVTRNDFAKAAEALRPAADVPALDPAALGVPSDSILAVRNWMAKYVRIAGPGLYELPVGLQLTAPETVLKERYATRLDYVRTLAALLRGAGYEADVVFVALDADDPVEARNRIKYEKPNVRAFSAALCRVRIREGGFLWFGGETKEYFLGTENEYAPLEASAYAGCDYFDPDAGAFGVVTVPDAAFLPRSEERSVYLVRENGGVDLQVENRTYGAGVGAFRKNYAEMLPEDRSRHYQELLGGVSRAATATKELETDVASYPALRRFECFVPNYAVVSGDSITLQLPPLASSLPSFTGKARETPFEVAAAEPEVETVTVRFPEGYVEAECLPESFAFANPKNPGEVWLKCEVSSEVRDGALEVKVVRTSFKRPYSWYEPEFVELIRDFYRRANSRASRTVVAKRKK